METVSCPYPGGQGPWFCALLFNTSRTSKKQTHLLAHTLPHLAADVLNKGSGRWVIMQKVGPFEEWTTCVAYLNEWMQMTRGRQKRLEKGMELFKRMQRSLSITMWVQTKPRETPEEAKQPAPRTRKRVVTETPCTLLEVEQFFKDITVPTWSTVANIKRIKLK